MVPRHRTLRDRARDLLIRTVKMAAKQEPKPKSLLSSSLARRNASEAAAIRFCVSSPEIAPLSRARRSGSPISGPASSLLIPRTGSIPSLLASNKVHTSSSLAKCAPPCKCGPCGCCPSCCPGCCSSLPPPCNTPPRCIQYMTGYYYYPYGFWFCGPYHVTGTCVPSGPCCPGGPCGPCCGPCGPCGPPCPSCSCPAPKCCACLSPITAAVVGGDPVSQIFQSMQPPTAVFESRPPKQPQPLVQAHQSMVPPQSQAQAHQPILSQAPPRREYQPVAQREGRPQPVRTKSGISKFFPFNTIPSFSSRDIPRSSVHVCPYSTQPQPQPRAGPRSCPEFSNPFRVQTPVYYTPTVKTNSRPSQRFSNSYERRSESRSPIHHKRTKRVNCELCPVLESPRSLLTKEQRDRPDISPGAFDYRNIPQFRKPFPPLFPQLFNERGRKERRA